MSKKTKQLTIQTILIERMSLHEYKEEGKNLHINISTFKSPYGTCLVGSTSKGICYLSFVTTISNALTQLQDLWPRAHVITKQDNFHIEAQAYLENPFQKNPIHLHISGTDFQFNVWEKLLDIPLGKTVTYKDIAMKIKNPKAFRAVGTAISRNKIAFIIPCHRVIQSNGTVGEYRWGQHIKETILENEKIMIKKL